MNLSKSNFSLLIFFLIFSPLVAMKSELDVPERPFSPGPINRTLSPELDDYNEEEVVEKGVFDSVEPPSHEICKDYVSGREVLVPEEDESANVCSKSSECAEFWGAIANGRVNNDFGRRYDRGRSLSSLFRKYGCEHFKNEVRDDGATPVFVAILFGSERAFRFLVDNGFLLHSGHERFSTLQVAIESGSVLIVKYLLAHFCEVRQETIRLGKASDNREIARIFRFVDSIEKAVKVTQDADLVRTQIGANPDLCHGDHILNFTDCDGETLLHHACDQGNESMAKALLNGGAYGWHRDKNGKGACDIAVDCCHPNIARLFTLIINCGRCMGDWGLKKIKAALDGSGLTFFVVMPIAGYKTFLHRIVARTYLDFVSLESLRAPLKDRRALALRDAYGNTILHTHFFYGKDCNLDLIRKMAKLGFNLEVKNWYGHSAMDFINQSCDSDGYLGSDVNSEEVLQIFEQHRQPPTRLSVEDGCRMRIKKSRE